jgi:hypothetical protein
MHPLTGGKRARWRLAGGVRAPNNHFPALCVYQLWKEGRWHAESIELLIEDQRVSPSYDLASPPPFLSPPSRVSNLSLFLGQEVGRGGTRAYDEGKKIWSSINHSVLYGSALVLTV